MDTFSWIKETTQDFSSLFKRNDEDKDLYNQLEYQLTDLQTKKPAKDVVNITLNDAKTFADRSQAFMNEANMQVVAEGRNLSDADTTLLENFDSDIRYEIDQRLMARGYNLFSFLIEQACIRGTAAARYVTWDNGDSFVPDCLPCDSRYLVYEYATKDLARASFKTIRTKAAIEEEYQNIKNLNVQGKKGAIHEYWDKEKCEIWLGNPNETMDEGGQLLKQLANPFGHVPFVIQGVGAGSMLQDEDAMGHKFESIFAANRLLYKHVNMLASILQTLNYMTFNRVYQWESEAGTQAMNPPKPGTRKTIPIDKGTRGLFPVEIADVNNATRLFYALLLGAIQRGSLPNIDYGNLTFPLSAVAISKITATKDAIFSPRLQAIALFYRKLHYMIRDQYVKGGYKAELGEEGLARIYHPADLDKKYKISYKFFAVSPEQDIANYAIAQQALAIGISKKLVYTNVLKLQDPEGEIMKARAERAEQLDPIIGLFRYGHALINQGTEESFLEADLVSDQIGQLLQQRYAIPMTGTPTDRTASPKSMIPLLEGGGGQSAGNDENTMAAPEEMLLREERRTNSVRKQAQEG